MLKVIAAKVMTYRRLLLWMAAVVAIAAGGCESGASAGGVGGPGIGDSMLSRSSLPGLRQLIGQHLASNR